MKTTIKVTLFALIALFFAANAVSAQDKPNATRKERQALKKDQQAVKMLCSCSKMMNDNQIPKGTAALEKERNNGDKKTETIMYECVASNKFNGSANYFTDSIDEYIIP